MTSLNNLIEFIQNNSDFHGSWKISRDEILNLLELDIRDVYKLIVSSPDSLVKFGTSSYSQDDAGALISFLECIGYEGAPQNFWSAGLWLPYEIQVELQESLINEIISVRVQHKIEYDTFLSIFDRVSSFPRSLDVYLEEYFSRDEITRSAIENFLKAHLVKTEDATRLLLQKLSHELFRREIIPFRNLFSDIFLKLKAFLISKDRLESPGKQIPVANKDQKNARQLFGYSNDQKILPKELNQRYKKLMRQYHPDVNPKGLEQAKRINSSYSILLGDDKSSNG